jgi:hypothetical protein
MLVTATATSNAPPAIEMPKQMRAGMEYKSTWGSIKTRSLAEQAGARLVSQPPTPTDRALAGDAGK